MLKTAGYALVFLSLVVLFYCGSKTTDTTPVQQTPKALQDKTIASYKRSGSNLMEDLYEELVNKSTELKTLEEDLETLRKRKNDLNEAFDHYDSKSTQYYSETTRANAISDSVLRNKINALLKTSQQKYSDRKFEITSLISESLNNNVILQDHHFALKIVLTLPLIEKYQIKNIPDKKGYSEFAADQKTAIKKLDALTPGF